MYFCRRQVVLAFCAVGEPALGPVACMHRASRHITNTVQRSGKPAQLADVQVGDRVVIDLPERTTKALLIQIGALAKATSHK